jgi:hypothetical protein
VSNKQNKTKTATTVKKIAATATTYLAHVRNVLFEHAVRRRVRDHQTAQFVAMLLCQAFQIVNVNVAVVVALHNDDFEPGHHGRSRVRAVRRRRNQTNVALLLPLRRVVSLDCRVQSCVLIVRFSCVELGVQKAQMNIIHKSTRATHCTLGPCILPASQRSAAD